MLTIDGVQYDVKCRITRTAEIRLSDISGQLLNKEEFNDVLGTYVGYDLVFEYPLYDQAKYAALYEVLVEPVDGHTFVLPYNTGTLQLTARVELVSDELLKLENGRKYWRNTQFSIIPNHPSKTMNLSEVITRGRAPLPDVADPQEGASYTWDGSSWQVSVEYQDADDIAY